MAVLLLPVYTSYLFPSDYAEVEILANTVIFVSIVVRFGMIEAFLRYHFAGRGQAERDALARRACGFLLVVTTAACVLLAAFARPLSQVLFNHAHVRPHDVETYLYGVLGLWAFTNLELAYGLLRVEERLRAYVTASLTNVALTIGGSLILVVGFHERARGLILANYAATAVVLAGVWFSMRHRLLVARAPAAPYATLLRFGLPTVPAEASVYLLFLIDRYVVEYDRGQTALGLYSVAVKLAGAVAFIVRAFQYAYPPLAYSVRDDEDASRLYGLITTYYVLVCGWAVAGLALEGRWVLRLLTAPRFLGGYRALPWVALGWALYGLWVVFLVIAGRAKVTTRNFAASLIGLAVNVGLLVALVPSLGIAGAGIALSGAYVAMLAVMYVLTRGLFAVRFEARRLVQMVVVFAALGAGGEVLLPTDGAVGCALRAVVFLSIPAVLYATGFAHPAELAQARALVGRLRRPGRGVRGAGERRAG
jgi:O-antigen/teichoic acid export membrane protein